MRCHLYQRGTVAWQRAWADLCLKQSWWASRKLRLWKHPAWWRIPSSTWAFNQWGDPLKRQWDPARMCHLQGPWAPLSTSINIFQVNPDIFAQVGVMAGNSAHARSLSATTIDLVPVSSAILSVLQKATTPEKTFAQWGWIPLSAVHKKLYHLRIQVIKLGGRTWFRCCLCDSVQTFPVLAQPMLFVLLCNQGK